MKLIFLDKSESHLMLAGFFWMLFFILSAAIRSVTLFFTVLFLCQIYFFCYFVYKWYKYCLSKKWVRVKLLNIESTFEESTQIGFDDELDVSSSTLNIKLFYQYFESTYSGNKLRYPFYLPSSKAKYALHQRIQKKGFEVVFVNPKKWNESVLLNYTVLSDYGLSALFLISELFVFWVAMVVYVDVELLLL